MRKSTSLSTRDFETASESNWALAVERERVIATLAAEKHVRLVDADSAATALQLSRVMVYRLVARYRRDPRTSALLPDAPGRKEGSFVLDSEIEAVVARSIKTFYLTPERPSISDLHRLVLAECRRVGLQPPSYKAVWARTKAIDSEEVVRRRFGPRAAKQRFRPVGTGGLRPAGPLSLYQIDHSPIDVMVVDEIERRPIGRPWLTVVIDVATRMIAGYYLSFDRPSSASVALALSHAVLPKEKHLQALGLTLDWPVSGLPEVVHLDNAKEFHARALERGSQEHGLRLEYRPPLRPNYGGHIERLIGTLMQATHLVPGTTFSSVKERGEYDSEGKAIMTIGELEIWFAMQIGIYNHGFHRGIGDKPIAAWKRGIRDTHVRRPTDSELFYIDFLPCERRLIRRDGIQLLGIHYWDNTLSGVAGRDDRPYLIRYDPHDLSKIFVKGVSSEGYLAIPYRDLAHPPITLMERRAALRELAKTKQRALTENAMFATVAAQRLLIERAQRKTLTARRRARQQPKPVALETSKSLQRSTTADDSSPCAEIGFAPLCL